MLWQVIFMEWIQISDNVFLNVIFGLVLFHMVIWYHAYTGLDLVSKHENMYIYGSSYNF